MIVWMRAPRARAAGGAARGRGGALAAGSAWALVAMAFLAVLREGIETAVFLLAAFQDATDPAPAGLGALLGLVVAVGARRAGSTAAACGSTSARFFRVTGAVLVLVAAGLVPARCTRAAEAGWIPAGSAQAFDLSGSSRPGRSRVAADRHARPAAAPTVDRGGRLAALRGADAALRPRAGPRCAAARARAPAPGFAVVAAPVVLVVGSPRRRGRPARAAARDGAGRPHGGGRARRTGCTPAHLRLASGPGDLRGREPGARAVTEYEVIDGGRDPGRGREPRRRRPGRFSLTLQPGRYTLRCPGGATSADGHARRHRRRGGRRRSTPGCGAGVDGYRGYLERETAALVDRTRRVRAAAARPATSRGRGALFASAREPYERDRAGRRVASATSTRDRRARQRRPSRASGRASTAIEQRAVGRGHDARDAPAGATGCWPTCSACRGWCATVELEPAQVANGAVELLGEVSKSKVTGEEDRYSHTDLVDFAANVDGRAGGVRGDPPGAGAARPGAARRDRPALRRRRRARWPATGAATGSSPTRRWRGREVRELAQAIDALAEPLSRAPARAARAVSARLDAARRLLGAAARRRGRPPRPAAAYALGRGERRPAAPREPSSRSTARHQAGIATPAQDRLHFAAFDVADGRAPRTCASCCATWTAAAARMTAGRPAGPRRADPLAPPDDTGEALGPRRLPG